MLLPAMSTVTIRTLGSPDRDAALSVINEAARWYRDFLPGEEYHEPEMTPGDWDREARRLAWYGAFDRDAIVGVMGLEYVRDVVLLRHAYILPRYQRTGVGNHLREHLEAAAARGEGRPAGSAPGAAGSVRIVVGTYRGNYKARTMLEHAGYHPSADPDAVLRAYYAIPEDRLRSSVTYEKSVPARPAR
jgi:GNAT superfamily N-acetyltransferase